MNLPVKLSCRCDSAASQISQGVLIFVEFNVPPMIEQGHHTLNKLDLYGRGELEQEGLLESWSSFAMHSPLLTSNM